MALGVAVVVLAGVFSDGALSADDKPKARSSLQVRKPVQAVETIDREKVTPDAGGVSGGRIAPELQPGGKSLPAVQDNELPAVQKQPPSALKESPVTPRLKTAPERALPAVQEKRPAGLKQSPVSPRLKTAPERALPAVQDRIGQDVLRPGQPKPRSGGSAGADSKAPAPTAGGFAAPRAGTRETMAPGDLTPANPDANDDEDAEPSGVDIPLSVTTTALEVIGSPNPPDEPEPFSPLSVTTSALAVIGNPQLPAETATEPFTPLTITTPPLAVVGSPIPRGESR